VSHDEFGWVVAEANRHINTRIYICCHLGLFSKEYANGGPQTLFDFKFNVELIGTIPEGGCPAPPVAQKASLRDMKVPEDCTTEKCRKATDQIIAGQNNQIDIFHDCLATIWSYGNIFLFEGKAKILYLFFIAGSYQGNNTNTKMIPQSMTKINTKKIAEFKEMDKLAVLKQVAQNDLFVYVGPNGFISGTFSGDASWELSVSHCVFVTDDNAHAQNVDNDCAFNSWFFISYAIHTEIEKCIIESFDFHIMLRYSADVKVKDSLLFYDSNMIIDIIECFLTGGSEDCEFDFELPTFAPAKDAKDAKSKRQPGELLTQLKLEIKDTGIFYTNLDDIFPFAPVDLGLVGTILSEILPEIEILELDHVFWDNIIRIIAPGSINTLFELGYDYQVTDIKDEVFLCWGWFCWE